MGKEQNTAVQKAALDYDTSALKLTPAQMLHWKQHYPSITCCTGVFYSALIKSDPDDQSVD